MDEWQVVQRKMEFSVGSSHKEPDELMNLDREFHPS